MLRLIDAKGQMLLPGDKVRVVLKGQESFVAVVAGPVEPVGTIVEKRIVVARLRQLGYELNEVVEVQGGKWFPTNCLERIGTTFEAASMSFPKLLESLQA